MDWIYNIDAFLMFDYSKRFKSTNHYEVNELIGKLQ